MVILEFNQKFIQTKIRITCMAI